MKTDAAALSESDKREARKIAESVMRGIDYALKRASGEIPRPKKSLRESMLELQGGRINC